MGNWGYNRTYRGYKLEVIAPFITIVGAHLVCMYFLCTMFDMFVYTVDILSWWCVVAFVGTLHSSRPLKQYDNNWIHVGDVSKLQIFPHRSPSTNVSFRKTLWDGISGGFQPSPQLELTESIFFIHNPIRFAELIHHSFRISPPGPQTQDFHPDSTRPPTFLGAVHVWSQSLWSHRWWATRQFGGLQLGYTKLQSPGAGFWKSPKCYLMD